jgi:hypothetical protein
MRIEIQNGFKVSSIEMHARMMKKGCHWEIKREIYAFKALANWSYRGRLERSPRAVMVGED